MQLPLQMQIVRRLCQALLQGGGAAERTLSMNLWDMLLLVLLGMIASATMVVPGVSGSMVLMMLGYYQSVLGLVNQLTRAAAAMDWALAGQSIVMLLPFLLGALIGIVLTAKGIRYLLVSGDYLNFHPACVLP
mgnify:CR=1 FL=1